jgi:hypothetical protein
MRVLDSGITLKLSKMKNIVPLSFVWPHVLQRVVIVGETVDKFCRLVYRAAAPRLILRFGERICTAV